MHNKFLTICKDCTKYWDEVKGEWRQFKNYNLIRVA
nr:MAG TPA: hypothetical protein [Caudoviricetes sp.]